MYSQFVYYWWLLAINTNTVTGFVVLHLRSRAFRSKQNQKEKIQIFNFKIPLGQPLKTNL